MDRTWTGVRRRVEALGALSDSAEVFGARGHRFLLEETLTAAQLSELEAQVGVELPEEYRGFLLHVGAGGAGPAYGLFPVRRVQGRWRWEGDGAELADLSNLGRPFPQHGPDPDELASLLRRRPEEEGFAEIEDFDDAVEAWDERWEDVMWKPERTFGAIVVSHLGCAYRQWLIITGPERGRIWSDDRAEDRDLVPLLTPDGQPATFAHWYLDWLERTEDQVLPAPDRV